MRRKTGRRPRKLLSVTSLAGGAVLALGCTGSTQVDMGPDQDASSSGVVTSNMNMPVYDAGLDSTADASQDAGVVTSNMNMPVYDAGFSGTTDGSQDDGSE